MKPAANVRFMHNGENISPDHFNGPQQAAHYSVPLDASDLARRTYIYVLRSEEQVAVRTMALLK